MFSIASSHRNTRPGKVSPLRCIQGGQMKELIPVEIIEKKIYLIRGHKVILDSDLAELYGVETK